MEYFNPFLCHPETGDQRASQADYQEPPAVLEAFKRRHGILNHIDTDATTIASVSNAPLPLPFTPSTYGHNLAPNPSAADDDAQPPTNSADTGAGWSDSHDLPIAVNTVLSERESALPSSNPHSAREPYIVDWPFSPDDTVAFLSLLYEPMSSTGDASSRDLTPQMPRLNGIAHGSLDTAHPSELLMPLYHSEFDGAELPVNAGPVQPYGEDGAILDTSRRGFAPLYVQDVDDDASEPRGTSYDIALQFYPNHEEIVSATPLDLIDGGRTVSPSNSGMLSHSQSHLHIHAGSDHAIPCHDHRCDDAHNALIEQEGAPHPNASQWTAEMQSDSLGPHVQTNNTIAPTNPPPPPSSPEDRGLPEVTEQYTPCVFCKYGVLTEVRGTTGTRRCDHFKQHYSGKDDWIPCPKLIELGVTWSVDKKTITAGIENVGEWLIEHHPSLILAQSVFAYGPLGRDLTRWLRQWWNGLKIRSPATVRTYVEGAKEEVRKREAARQSIAQHVV